jgi:hypothetical protein
VHKILSLQINKDSDLVQGNALEILAILNESYPTTITISIEDPTDVLVVNAVSMTRLTNKVYQYIYQSDENGTEGTYTVTVKSTKGGYTSVRQASFDLRDIDEDFGLEEFPA